VVLAAALLAVALLGACGGSDGDPRLEGVRVAPFRADDPWAEALQECLAIGGADFEPCSFDRLPPLTRQGAVPTLADVASRLLVGQPWMGERLLEVFDAAPDTLRWAGSITGIVVGAGIAPSFLSLRTGAIYLDPRHLAVTADELAEASGGVDPREDYEAPLRFTTPWRYAVPEHARGLEAVLPGTAAVLYHELAHALDQFPAADVLGASGSVTPIEFVRGRADDQSVSSQLPEVHPLTASRLFDLTRVTVDGDTPSADQREFTAAQAASDFEHDGATDFYAYFSPQEDLALLVEEFQVSRWFGTDRELVVEDRQDGVVWGQAGRIGAPQIRTRLRWVLSGLLPAGLDEALEAVDRLQPPTSLSPRP
jgi:hypothetical protein